MATLAEFKPARRVRVLKRLNVRSQPTTAAQLVGRVEPGTYFDVTSLEQGESILGIDGWYRSTAGSFFWSAPTELEELPATPQKLDVPRRVNGTIAPLQDVGAVYGSFACRPGKQGAVIIDDPGWVKANLVDFSHGMLARVGAGTITLHRLVVPHFKRVFDEIQARGLQDCILTYDGSFVPRYKNWDPASGQLSSHSWGIAIDLNARFNAARRQPALPGERGCLRELVPIFNAAGFAWGGHFSSPVDGMHFELALRKP